MKEEVKLLLNKIKDLKGEFDVDRVARGRSNNKVSPADVTRPEVDSTSSKTVKQTVHLSIKPFCDLLTTKDDKTVHAVLDVIANILTTAEQLNETDKVAIMVEKCGGLDRIEQLQSHENELIYLKALDIIEKFFPDGDQIVSR